MKRNVSFNEISDGKKYKSDDLVKVSCNGCKGCSECCRFTDDTIFLDPYDIYSLSKGLNKSFQDMLGSIIDLTVSDGVITPYLKKDEATHCCCLLTSDGLCSIHDFRPGFCRLFPLGRIYDEDGNFDYFIQVHECPYPGKTKVKVKKWLGIENLSKYEDFIKTWHEITGNVSACNDDESSIDLAKAANMKLLNVFFIAPYDTESDFYSQFSGRLYSYTS